MNIAIISSLTSALVVGFAAWYFRKVSTPKESLREDMEIKLTLLNTLVDNLSKQLEGCKTEISELKSELASDRFIFTQAFNCKYGKECPVIKKIQNSNSYRIINK